MFMRNKITTLTLATGLLGVLAAPAWAVDTVNCVRWQGDPAKFHTVISGQSTTLKCVVKTDSTATRYYKWIYGDGTSVTTGNVSGSTKYNFEVGHTYAGTSGLAFTATLQVDNVDASMSHAVSGNYLAKIEDNALDAQINVAIDMGLWWLYKNPYTSGVGTVDGSPFLSWRSSTYGVYASPTASTVQAFAINNHKFHGDPNDPYVEAVQLGMNFLAKGNLALQAIGIPDAAWNVPAANGNPNGIGIEAHTNWNHVVYEGGQIMDGIIASGVLPTDSTGRNFDGTHVWTYGELLQDLADMYIYYQHSPNGAWAEWYFTNGEYDNSSSQWAAIGLIPAQAAPWNVKVPASLMAKNAAWLAASYCANHCTGYTCGATFGYQGACSVNDNGFNTTPSGMVMMDMDGQIGYWDRVTPAIDPRDSKWVGTEKFMADNWMPFMNTNSPSWGNMRGYGYYAMAKAMRLAAPKPVEFIEGSGGTAFDWYRGDATRLGLAQNLVNRQAGDGHWDGLLAGPELNTAWMTIVLKPSLFAASPIACFTAAPNPSYANQDITFDPSCSGHSESGKNIANLTEFAWDWDNNGVYDSFSAAPTTQVHQFACAVVPCAYPVKLKVTDDNTPPLTATYSLTINITNPPHPPVANAGGPYVVSMCTRDTVALDGSNSFDQDTGQHQAGCSSCPNDGITLYEWDLVPAASFDAINATGVKPIVASSMFGIGSTQIGLRVWDNTLLAYPSSGQPNLSGIGYSQVDALAACACDLTAIAKSGAKGGLVQLNWAPVALAASYDILRSTAGPNTGFATIKSGWVNPLAVYVDQTAAIGTKYWYRVIANRGTAPHCESVAVSATPPTR